MEEECSDWELQTVCCVHMSWGGAETLLTEEHAELEVCWASSPWALTVWEVSVYQCLQLLPAVAVVVEVVEVVVAVDHEMVQL